MTDRSQKLGAPRKRVPRRGSYGPHYERWKVRYCARLKELRQESGMTQDEAATILGEDPQRYKPWESKTPLPTYMIDQVCRLFGCEVEWLVVGRGPKRRPGHKMPPHVAAHRIDGDRR